MPVSPAPDATTAALVLLSGGLESTVAATLYARRGPVHALFVAYDQRAVTAERAAAEAVADTLGITLHVADLTSLGRLARGDRAWQRHVPLPHRNACLVGTAASLAPSLGCASVVLGINAEDASAVADAGVGFLEPQALALEALGVSLTLPLSRMTKAEVVRLGGRIGAPIAQSYSCLLGRRPPCGGCPQCRKRAEAEALAGSRPAPDW